MFYRSHTFCNFVVTCNSALVGNTSVTKRLGPTRASTNMIISPLGASATLRAVLIYKKKKIVVCSGPLPGSALALSSVTLPPRQAGGYATLRGTPGRGRVGPSV